MSMLGKEALGLLVNRAAATARTREFLGEVCALVALGEPDGFLLPGELTEERLEARWEVAPPNRVDFEPTESADDGEEENKDRKSVV